MEALRLAQMLKLVEYVLVLQDIIQQQAEIILMQKVFAQ